MICRSKTKQYSLFDKKDILPEKNQVKYFCEICNKELVKGSICSDLCGKKWINLYIDSFFI